MLRLRSWLKSDQCCFFKININSPEVAGRSAATSEAPQPAGGGQC